MTKNFLTVAEEVAKRREAVPVSEMKRKALRPLNQWVLIRKVQKQAKLIGENLIVDEQTARSSMGEVVASAAGLNLNVGDVVIYTNFPIELEDVEELTGDKSLQLVRYEEIYAVVEDAE